MEEQKKTQGEAGGDSLFDGGFDTAVPERPWATLKRLWHTAQDQHLRLLVVVLSVVCYTALAIAAPYYSAGIVDLLWENIQRAQGLGEAFVVTWRQGDGRSLCSCSSTWAPGGFTPCSPTSWWALPSS